MSYFKSNEVFPGLYCAAPLTFVSVLNCLEVYLEGERQTTCSIMKKIVLPFIPFLIVITAVLVYLQYGGVCYSVEDSLFWYQGCQLCPDMTPPVDNMCPVGNSTNSTNVTSSTNVTYALVDPNSLIQGTYCSKGRNFCFFNY